MSADPCAGMQGTELARCRAAQAEQAEQGKPEEELDRSLTDPELGTLNRWNDIAKREDRPTLSQGDAYLARSYLESGIVASYEEALNLYSHWVQGNGTVPAPWESQAWLQQRTAEATARQEVDKLRRLAGEAPGGAAPGLTLPEGAEQIPLVQEIETAIAGHPQEDWLRQALLLGAMVEGTSLVAGPDGLWPSGDNGRAKGPYQIHALSLEEANDPARAVKYMMEEHGVTYPFAVRKVAELYPNIWENDPQTAALMAVFLAEKPSGWVDESTVTPEMAYAQYGGQESVAAKWEGLGGTAAGGGLPTGPYRPPTEAEGLELSDAEKAQLTLLDLSQKEGLAAKQLGISFEMMAAVSEASDALDITLGETLQLFQDKPPERIPDIIRFHVTQGALKKARPTATEQEIREYALRSIQAGLEPARAAYAFGQGLGFEDLQTIERGITDIQAANREAPSFESAISGFLKGRTVQQTATAERFERQNQRWIQRLMGQGYSEAQAIAEVEKAARLGGGDVAAGFQEIARIQARQVQPGETPRDFAARQARLGATADEIQRRLETQFGRQEITRTLEAERRRAPSIAAPIARFAATGGPGDIIGQFTGGVPTYGAFPTNRAFPQRYGLRFERGGLGELQTGLRMREAFQRPRAEPAGARQLREAFTALGTEDVFRVGAGPEQGQRESEQEELRRRRGRSRGGVGDVSFSILT